ncbi:hypothetical protein [Flammeovirga kamogawensis]|uniref:Uncharacterized protein n=1 Tax=Flammeovirga kamogawensis TaxID=373891 RepID=A0ABX8H2M3_9BACT|nr:hypothetical protein [Flammeovirga kamogawensis]MBB6462613.1 hypothetical protein [Flammeovirga kamogawensis]QWG09642.1 hypothetical protein KM029_23855 [Flammeovirga kamogawensis]TRX65156.1 hypothetical protein EO216_21755 [Flammeovirga kamogawensis]
MNKKYLLIILLLHTFLGYSQSRQKTNISYKERVHTAHKGNEQLKHIGITLLSAFQNGELKGYYPNNTSKVMSFESFYFHFRGIHNSNIVMSNCAKTKTDFTELFSYFSNYFDLAFIVRQKEIANNLHQQPEYLQLYLSSDYSPSGIEYKGPIFLIDDIINLNIELPVKDNLAVKLSVGNLLVNHQYQAEIISIDDQIKTPVHRSEIEGTFAH